MSSGIVKKIWKKNNPEKVKMHRKTYNEKHRDERCAYNHEHYLKNREKKAVIKALWKKNNPGKVRIQKKNYRYLKRANGTGVTTQQWEDIVRKYNYRCAYCGRKCYLTVDHVIPVSKGGEHSPCNIVPACVECNSKKGVKLWKPKMFRRMA